MGETEYQFGFGGANQSDRNVSLDLIITYQTDEPVPDGNAKFDLKSGYTISMYVKFDSACHDPVPDPATDLNWYAAGCSLLEYSNQGSDWYGFECGYREFWSEPWRADPDNDHLFINLHELTGDASLKSSQDLSICSAACRNASFPLMEMGSFSNSESFCKCFHVVSHHGKLSMSTCPGYARAIWYSTTDAFTLGVGVRNGKIYFGDNTQMHVDCSHLGLYEDPDEVPCDATGHIPLFTTGDNYNDGQFHHVVAEYSASEKRMRLAVSTSDGSGYEIVEDSVLVDGVASSVNFASHRESRSSLWINDWAANPYPGNGWVELDTGAWTLNAGGNGGYAGANMHSIRAYEGAYMDKLLDATENPPPQPATSQDQCGCTLYHPPGAPPDGV